MKNIFVYGSLMFDEIWNRVVNRRYRKQQAVLPGYKRMTVRGKNYPGLIRSINSSVPGVIYHHVTAQDIKRLDKFEGRNYRKRPVTVLSDNIHRQRATAYLFVRHKTGLLTHKQWDPDRFRAHHLHKYTVRYKTRPDKKDWSVSIRPVC